MDYKEYKGKNLEDAIINAAAGLGVITSEVDYVVVEKGKSGFLGIGAKPAIIRARVKSKQKPENKPLKKQKASEVPASSDKQEKGQQEKSRPEKNKTNNKNNRSNENNRNTDKKPANPAKKPREIKNTDKNTEKKQERRHAEISQEIIDETRKFLEEFFRLMNLKTDSIDVRASQGDRTLEIDVEGPDMGIIIGKRGQTLDSLQYLISLYVNKFSDTYIRVKLDTENYRDRRRETLENLAKNIAFKVKKTRRPFRLEPMNPYERRIIHATLQNNKYVTTKSEGEEPYRRVVVIPKKQKESVPVKPQQQKKKQKYDYGEYDANEESQESAIRLGVDPNEKKKTFEEFQVTMEEENHANLHLSREQIDEIVKEHPFDSGKDTRETKVSEEVRADGIVPESEEKISYKEETDTKTDFSSFSKTMASSVEDTPVTASGIVSPEEDQN